MPHERNEERRRGIGFQEVLKSIREPFLTLVFSRNDCSQILEIFFLLFFPLSLFSFPEILSVVLHTEIILLILLLAFFQYFFYFFHILCYLRIFRFFISSPKRRSRLILIKNKRIRKLFKKHFKNDSTEILPPRRIVFLPTESRFAESRTNETNNDQSLV